MDFRISAIWKPADGLGRGIRLLEDIGVCGGEVGASSSSFLTFVVASLSVFMAVVAVVVVAAVFEA